MKRRDFLRTLALSVASAPLLHCAMSVSADPSPDSTQRVDGNLPESSTDVATADVSRDSSTSVLIPRRLVVLLNDSSCSGHDHMVTVLPQMFANDEPVRFLSGSHTVQFRPSELLAMLNGSRLPFATVGPSPGHGHCGMAWEYQRYPAERNRQDGCRTLGTATCELR